MCVCVCVCVWGGGGGGGGGGGVVNESTRHQECMIHYLVNGLFLSFQKIQKMLTLDQRY